VVFNVVAMAMGLCCVS